MNLIFIITYLAAVAISVDAYHKVELVPNGKPFPGLKRGTRDEVLPSADPGKTDIIQARIVDGQYAKPEQFPYHVGLLVGFGTNVYAFCGGTLIGNEWIITAAHCTTGGSTFEVRLGNINIETPLRVSWGYQNHIHPDFGKKNGDVALVKIQWVDYNVNMAPAALPALHGHHSMFVNDRVVATGWGAINNHGDRGDQLKYVIMTVMEPQNCANIYGSNAKEPAIMCTNTKGVGSTCSGDSGSPLVLENTRLLVGVTAFGGGGCGGGLPAGFQRITFYLDWIKDISGISW